MQEAIEDFGEDVTGPTSSPARKNLFDVDQASTLLPLDKKELFHSIVQKLLYVSHRGRSDIQPTVAFLSTRVSKSTKQDWGKLRRLLQYLNETIDLTLTLGADSFSKLTTWVDAAYAVHPDMRSQTGGALSLGTGAFIGKSTKQKINVKSSTEAETVGASDYLPHTIWAMNFLKAQGFDIETSIFNQDNESAIRLEKNGRASAGPKSRHINIRYFFIKDRVKGENISIVHCPTDQMLADFFTKALQGALFRKFRDVLLGYKHIDVLRFSPSVSSEERVGNSEVVRSVPDEQSNDQKNNATNVRTYADVVKNIKKRTNADVVETVTSKLPARKRVVFS
jgi:hypothetical protein